MQSPKLSRKLFLLISLISVSGFGATSVFISRSASAPGADIVARPSAEPMASPAPAGIRQITLNTKDLVFDPVGQRIYASLPSTAPNGNSIVQIDPFAGTVGSPVSLGSEPGRLAFSDDS